MSRAMMIERWFRVAGGAVLLWAATPGLDALSEEPFVVVLGIAQDAGFPQAGCRKACCAEAFRHPDRRRMASSLAVVDPDSSQRWLLDCTPDFRDQLRMLDELAPAGDAPGLTGIFPTHAHIGHYSGLIHLGREAMGTRRLPVFAMPRMAQFLRDNGPWSQLVGLENIEIRPLADGNRVALNERLSITPLLVPHRDEYSETVAFRVAGPSRTVLYLPDIDKWERWETSIEKLLTAVDVAYLDGTFFADGELPGRNMAEIPHPFIVESIRRFRVLRAADRGKVRFIHLNHTNPALDPASDARRQVLEAGHRVAEQGERVEL